MLGLLQCSVPPVLKAEILHCLAAFGKSPEIAASLWQSLEYTQVSRTPQTQVCCCAPDSELSHFGFFFLPQILQTVRAPGQRQAAGIEVSLQWLW